jgi:hypothetical protein
VGKTYEELMAELSPASLRNPIHGTPASRIAQSRIEIAVAVIVRLAELLVVMCVLLQINPMQAQAAPTGTAATVTVGSMAEAMDVLVSRYGYVVTLETPRYVCADDLEDQPAEFQRGTPRRIFDG